MTASQRLVSHLIAGLLLACVGSAVQAADSVSEPTGALNLEQALALALSGNARLQAYSWETRAAEGRELQASMMPNPELDIRLWRLGEQRGQTDVSRRRVVFSQEFELGGKRGRRVDVARAEHRTAGWRQEAMRREVSAGVRARFIDVLGGQRRVESWSRFVDFLEQLRERVRGLVDSGLMRRIELPQVTRRHGLATIELQRVESELSVARYRLAATWGSDTPRFDEVVGDLERVVALPDVATVIELGRKSPALAGKEAEMDRSQAAVDLARAGRVPDLTFGAGVRWEDDIEPDYLVDFEIALPIFDRKRGAVVAARHDAARAEAAHRAAASASAETIAELYHEAQRARATSATLAGDVIGAARETFEAYEIAYEANADSVDDLVDAHRDLTRAEVLYAEALMDYHTALAGLESIVGQSLIEDE